MEGEDRAKGRRWRVEGLSIFYPIPYTLYPIPFQEDSWTTT